MSIKGASATKGIFRHFASTARAHFESQNSDAVSINADLLYRISITTTRKAIHKAKDSLKTETH